MNQPINKEISALVTFDCDKKRVTPIKIRWGKRVHKIDKIGFHHKYKKGNTLYHVFSVCNKDLHFRLLFDTDTLIWVLQEISDGNTN